MAPPLVVMIMLLVYQYIWTYRSFAGGYVPLFGELEGGFWSGMAMLAVGVPIVFMVVMLGFYILSMIYMAIITVLISAFKK